MKNYSANLYRKFKTRALNTLNGDDFYEYFMNVVESGARFYGQKNQPYFWEDLPFGISFSGQKTEH